MYPRRGKGKEIVSLSEERERLEDLAVSQSDNIEKPAVSRQISTNPSFT